MRKSHTVRIEFDEETWGLFRESGLKSFEDFFNYSAGKIINKNQKRDVLAFSLRGSDKQRYFFMKRFFNPHYKDMLFTLRNFGRLCSQAACEWQNARTLLQNGIGTYTPVCYGEETHRGQEKRSFFITEKIPGCCMTDFVRDNWTALTHRDKEVLMTSLGRFVRRIHDAQISMPDLYVWHIFLQSSDDKYDFAVIDLHRMRTNAASDRQRIRNLGALDFSMVSKYFDQDMRDVLLNAYFGADFAGDKTAFCRRITNRSMILANRRKPPDY